MVLTSDYPSSEPEIYICITLFLRLQKKVYGLYPTSKFGTDSIISICPINALDLLITDDDPLEEDLKAIEENGVEILLTV